MNLKKCPVCKREPIVEQYEKCVGHGEYVDGIDIYCTCGFLKKVVVYDNPYEKLNKPLIEVAVDTWNDFVDRFEKTIAK